MAKSLEDASRERRAETLEALVELYLRLNGYFCIPNYLYHRVGAFGLRTESDVLAVRMPHQREMLPDGREQPNDPKLVLSESEGWIDCVIAEVKEPAVEFNRPLRDAGGAGLIGDAVRMFGVLPNAAFESPGVGRRIADELHGLIKAICWPSFPRADSSEDRLWVRMIVFAPQTATHAANRAFMKLEEVLPFVRKRMALGEPCSPYRDQNVSPWRGTKRLIVEAFDRVPSHENYPLEQLLDEVIMVSFEVFWQRLKNECSTWPSLEGASRAKAIRKWSADKGDMDGQFIAVWSGGDTLLCNTEDTDSPRTISRAEFEKVYNVWQDYTGGAKGRSYIVHDLGVQNATWIIPILHRHKHLMH